MFDEFTWQSHQQYLFNLRSMKVRFSSDQRARLQALSNLRAKLSSLNLDPIGDYLSHYYPPFGRPARNQAQILRSLILFVSMGNKSEAGLSLTYWVKFVLPNDSVLVALMGAFSSTDLPPLGSYYDFMNRLWNGARDLYKRNSLLPAGKNSKKPKKDIGTDGKLAEEDTITYSTRDIADQILSSVPTTNNPEAILQDIFFLAAVLPSMKQGIIAGRDLTLSGDGTAVAVHTSPYGKPLKSPTISPDCHYDENCPRHYSDPDADWGWDSSKRAWYFGRTLYMICYRSNAYKVELPILMKFTRAKRHDSINFLYAYDELRRHIPGVHPRNFCLDSAHDNIPTYRLLEEHGINALIDLNGRNKPNSALPDDIHSDSDGIPVCKGQYRMKYWGYDRNKDAVKYRCPLKCGDISDCPYSAECSKGSYGRTIYIKKDDDYRFHTSIPRGTERYKKIYSERTASERVNNRVLNNYHLLEMKIRGDEHYSFMTMIIGICIHLDAQMKVKNASIHS